MKPPQSCQTNVNAKPKRPGEPGRFVPSAMLLVLVRAVRRFSQLRRTILRLARSS